MSTQDSIILRRLKARLAERLPLQKVVLFGSRARGDNEPDSDMDVLVVLDGPVSREAESHVRRCAWELGYENGIVIFPLTVSRADWEQGLVGATMLASAVRSEGVEV